MCKERTSIQIRVGNKFVKVDSCIKDLIKFINLTQRRKTVACCCGHKKYNMTIVVNFGNHFIEIVSGIPIPRKNGIINGSDALSPQTDNWSILSPTRRATSARVLKTIGW